MFLGLIHAEDGVDGATRRIRTAAKTYPDFGVAAFCGLIQPSQAEFHNTHSVEELFDMHRGAALAG